MNTDYHEELAKILDSLPNGFPRTKSGIELKILRKIFTDEEAEITCGLKLMPETPEQIAERLGRDAGTMGDMLEKMVERGEIGGMGPSESRAYHLAPFIVGIFEFQTGRMDKELATLMEEYVSEGLFAGIGHSSPAFMKTIPVIEAVDAQTQIHPTESVRQLMDKATVFITRDCICRKEQELLEHKCDKPQHNCISMSTNEDAFGVDYDGQIVNREEAEKIIADAEDAGLVHATMNLSGDTYHFCNCCACCCNLLRGVTQFGAPGMLAKSNYWAEIDADDCSSCGTCIDDRCPANAISEHDDGYSVVSRDNCLGCGVCISTCPTDSITLVRKPEDQCVQAPPDMVSWMMERSAATGKPLDKYL